jgi:hypothetical protein
MFKKIPFCYHFIANASTRLQPYRFRANLLQQFLEVFFYVLDQIYRRKPVIKIWIGTKKNPIGILI